MSMIQFPSDHKDAKTGNQHVAGSQDAANKQCAQNMRKGAFSILHSKTKGPTTGRVVQDGKPARKTTDTLTITLFAVAGAVFLIALMAR